MTTLRDGAARFAGDQTRIVTGPAALCTAAAKLRGEFMASPLTWVIRSPGCSSPAAAGVPGVTLTTRTPSVGSWDAGNDTNLQRLVEKSYSRPRHGTCDGVRAII